MKVSTVILVLGAAVAGVVLIKALQPPPPKPSTGTSIAGAAGAFLGSLLQKATADDAGKKDPVR
jgi:hypothetical protein